MSSQPQRVALPAYLPKRLQAFRIGKPPNESYLVRDKLHDRTYDFEPWQFFVLEVLPGCENFAKLASVFQDRFGRPIEQHRVNELLAMVANDNLLDDGASHPLLVPFSRKGYTTESGTAVVKPFLAPVTPASAAASAAAPATASSSEDDLPAGVQDAVGLDPRAARRIRTLFDPRSMLKAAAPWVTPLRHAIYLLPFLALAATALAIQNDYLIREDMQRLLRGVTLFNHVVFSLFTVNALVTLTTAFVAHHYRATVNGIGIALYFGFLPRFVAQARNLKQMSRRERIWLHAAPLLMRIGLLCLGLLVWYGSRGGSATLQHLGLSLAMICSIALLFSANPLVRGSGYHLLAAFLDEPHLRGKAYKALLNRYHGGVYQQANDGVLSAYALACLAFMFVLTVVAVLVFGMWLRGMQLGGTAIILITAVSVYLYQRTARRFRKIDVAYERSAQFERWRTRAVPTDTAPEVAEARAASGIGGYVRRAVPLTLVVVLLLPYPYDVGGNFTIFPNQRQDLATDIAGVVAEVNYDGGETLRKGTVIARLAHDNYRAELESFEARLLQQRAIINDLKQRPKREEVRLAQNTLEVARTQAAFSREELARIKKLYEADAVSYEEFAKQQRQYEVDAKQVAEKEAALALVRAGATTEQIEAEEAKWQSLKAERDAVQSMIERSTLVMPFDGTILTLRLKSRTNSYLRQGEVFAVVENSGQIVAEIEVPESDIGYVARDAVVRARTASYNQDIFAGVVKTIDRNVTVKPYGNIIKVVAVMDNADGKLLTGMTGYAKIKGETMPVWKAFSLAVLRFVKLQVWSWIP
jgi:putative peptide zinc metalloprotease protein